MKWATIFPIAFLLLAPLALAEELAIEKPPGIDPISPFYFLESAKEQLSLLLTFAPQKVARLHARLAEKRLKQAEYLLRKNQTEKAQKFLEDHQKRTKLALESDDNETVSTVKHNEEILRSLIDKFERDENIKNDNALDGLRNALSNSEERRERLIKNDDHRYQKGG